MQILRQIFIIVQILKTNDMDIIKIGRVDGEITKRAFLYETNDLIIERVFTCDECFIICVTRKITDISCAVYYMSFCDILSMFTFIDFVCNPKAE